jgi:hypothetical protein
MLSVTCTLPLPVTANPWMDSASPLIIGGDEVITNAIEASNCRPAPAPNGPWKLSPVDTASLIGVTKTAVSTGSGSVVPTAENTKDPNVSCPREQLKPEAS